MTAQQRPDQQRSDRRVAEQAPTYAAESREADGRARSAARRRARSESLAAVIERRRAVLLRLADS